MKKSVRPQLFQHISLIFFPLQWSIFLSLMAGWGEDSCIWGGLCLCKSAGIPGDRNKEVLVCSLGIVAHKKHSHFGCAVLKGLSLQKNSLLLQEWYDLLLLLEWGLFAPVVVNCACGHTLLKFSHQLSGTKHPMHHSERGKMKFFLCRWFDGADNLNGHLCLSLLTTCPFASKENKTKFISNSLLRLGQLRVLMQHYLVGFWSIFTNLLTDWTV